MSRAFAFVRRRRRTIRLRKANAFIFNGPNGSLIYETGSICSSGGLLALPSKRRCPDEGEGAVDDISGIAETLLDPLFSIGFYFALGEGGNAKDASGNAHPIIVIGAAIQSALKSKWDGRAGFY
jgi:hypothetical protein